MTSTFIMMNSMMIEKQPGADCDRDADLDGSRDGNMFTLFSIDI